MKLRLHPLLNLNEIGFGDRISKSVDDVSADKFEDFGVYVGQLYQKFLKKDISADPAIAQKILDLVSDDEKLMNQVKDLEFLINQLPDRPKPKDKIGFKEEKINGYDFHYTKGTSGGTQQFGRPRIVVEDHPINSPIDLINNDILNIPEGSVGEIKRAAAKLGIDPQNKYESELRDEIDDLLTNGMSIYEEYELVKKYFGDYADELIHQYGLKIDEEHPHDLPPDDKSIEKIKEYIKENLRNWFKKEKWKRIDTQGNIAGDCGTMPKGKKTQRCLPAAKAHSLSKKDRAATSRKKTASNKQFVSNTKAAK